MRAADSEQWQNMLEIREKQKDYSVLIVGPFFVWSVTNHGRLTPPPERLVRLPKAASNDLSLL